MKVKLVFIFVFAAFLGFLLSSVLSQQVTKKVGERTDTLTFRFTFPDDLWQTVKNNPTYKVALQYRKLGTTGWQFYGTVQNVSNFEGWRQGNKTISGASIPAEIGVREDGVYQFRIIGAASNLSSNNFEFESTYLRLSFCGVSECDVGLGDPSVVPAVPVAGANFTIFTIQCPANNRDYDCIEAYRKTDEKCTFKEWKAREPYYNATFECGALPAGNYTAICKTKTGTAHNCTAAEKKTAYGVIETGATTVAAHAPTSTANSFCFVTEGLQCPT